MEQKYDVFISYNARDLQDAEKLAKLLQDAGLRVWFEPWEWSIRTGARLFSAVSEALEDCTNLLVLIGSHGVEPYPRGELQTPFERAARSAYRIIPVLLPGSQPTLMPMFLRTRMYCDLREWDEKQLKRLTESLQPAPRVFLCHAKEDETKVEKLFHYLKGRGVDAWYDKKKLKIGDVWREEIFQAIEETDFFAVCLSVIAVRKKGFIQNEIRTAIQEYQKRPFGTKYLLPLKLNQCEVPKIRLDSQTLMDDLQWLELSDDEDETFKNLADEIWDVWHDR